MTFIVFPIVVTGNPGESIYIGIPGLVGGNTYYYLLRAENNSGQVSGWSDYAYAVPQSGPTPKILVVNGNYNTSTTYVAGITKALDALGIEYDSWTIASDGSPTAFDLDAYTTGMVFWSVGYFYNGYGQLGTAQESALKSYLDAGGNLSAWNPDASSSVYALAVSGGTVYAGGVSIFAMHRPRSRSVSRTR